MIYTLRNVFCRVAGERCVWHRGVRGGAGGEGGGGGGKAGDDGS